MKGRVFYVFFCVLATQVFGNEEEAPVPLTKGNATEFVPPTFKNDSKTEDRKESAESRATSFTYPEGNKMYCSKSNYRIQFAYGHILRLQSRGWPFKYNIGKDWCGWLLQTQGDTDLELACRTFDLFGRQDSPTSCYGDKTIIYDGNHKEREDCDFNLNYRSVSVRLHTNMPAIYFSGAFEENRYRRGFDCSAFGTCKCGVNGRYAADRIIEGRYAGKNEFPWTAGLYDSSGQLFCGGVLVGQRHVLTAAHCVRGSHTNNMRVYLGGHTLGEQVGVYSVYKISIHPQYKQNSDGIINFDLAMLELNRDVECSNRIRPICLPNNDYKSYTDYTAIISGWGTTDANDHSGRAQALVRAAVTIAPKNYCQDRISKLNAYISKDELCVRSGSGIDTCDGDSGGPLTIYDPNEGRHVLVGIASTYFNRCGEVPSIYSRVTSAVHWIKQIVYYGMDGGK